MDTYGTIPDGGIINANKYEKIVSNNLNVNGSITQTITCDWSDIDSNTPALSSYYTGSTTYILTSVTQEELPASLAKITLTYTAQYDSLPATTVVEQNSMERVAIQEHPSFSSWSSEWDNTAGAFIPSSSKYGITDYVTGSTTATLTEYFESKPGNNGAHIGKLQYPGGDCIGDATNWLVIGSNRQQQGIFWVRVTTYQYSAKAWNSDIYSTV